MGTLTLLSLIDYLASLTLQSKTVAIEAHDTKCVISHLLLIYKLCSLLSIYILFYWNYFHK